jgi:predicted NodU family carbamoyl transferase
MYILGISAYYHDSARSILGDARDPKMQSVMDDF